MIVLLALVRHYLLEQSSEQFSLETLPFFDIYYGVIEFQFKWSWYRVWQIKHYDKALNQDKKEHHNLDKRYPSPFKSKKTLFN